jgi:hypothetical protein
VEKRVLEGVQRVQRLVVGRSFYLDVRAPLVLNIGSSVFANYVYIETHLLILNIYYFSLDVQSF